jgi:UDP-N-acetylmuramyl pentapeptide phosphotransferase/UDP-N-acetylglucosamine-1-phosphate transferase
MAVFCGMANQYLLLMVCVAMVGLLGPFLFRNVLGWRVGWRKLFFGDTGGLTIGYILAYIVISVSRMGGDELPVGIGMACFGTLLIPMFDVMRVGITRLVNGRNVFRAGDRNHIHHRLIQAGLQPRQVLMVVLLITAEFIGLNIWGVLKGWNLSLLLVVDVTAWGLIQVVIMYYKNRGREKA